MDPKSRFLKRAEDYVRYRPGYPDEVFNFLWPTCHLGPHPKIADLGSGTGQVTRGLLDKGAEVFAVEPNSDMREVAERQFSSHPCFRSLPKTAEMTGLDARSLDLVTIGSALHWFEPEHARHEIQRILKPDGWFCVLGTPVDEKKGDVEREIRTLLRSLAINDEHIRNRVDDMKAFVKNFFAPATIESYEFAHDVSFDFEALLGFFRSHSTMPLPGDEGYVELVTKVQRLFDIFQVNGVVAAAFRATIGLGRF